MYFPLHVHECLLIEPTETEPQQTLDTFAAAMQEILVEALEHPEVANTAPHTTPVGQLDEAKAAREPDLVWRGGDPGRGRCARG
jgi:glycine dehydrogenase subunit 2